MKIYISGPMTGLPDLNRDAFYDAYIMLTELGHEPVNPHYVNAHLGDNEAWETYMRNDIKALMDCDAIYMLKNFTQSKGAMVEYRLASDLKMRIYSYKQRPLRVT